MSCLHSDVIASDATLDGDVRAGPNVTKVNTKGGGGGGGEGQRKGGQREGGQKDGGMEMKNKKDGAMD